MSMEAKASKMSQRSGSQTQKMSKTPSKASITPSQMSERTRLNLANQNRDPLDALSRMTQRQMAERRSGLQDVDDDYLKNVVYAYAGRTKTAAAQRNEVRADMIPAGVPTLRPPHRQGQRVAAGAEQTAQETSARTQQSAEVAAAVAAAQGQVAQEKMMANQPTGVTQPNQEAAAAQQQQSNPVAPTSPQAAGHAAATAPDPEMYTTCPNCRATLYLVRNIGDPSPYGTQPTPQQSAQPQQQEQQQQKQSQQPPAQQSSPAPVPVQQ